MKQKIIYKLSSFEPFWKGRIFHGAEAEFERAGNKMFGIVMKAVYFLLDDHVFPGL